MKKINVGSPINNIRGEQLKDEKGKSLTIGDMLLNILSQNIKLKENKEAFWVTEMGIMIANAKGEIELSPEKFEFLKRIVTANKHLDLMRKEEDFFIPFILGQLMVLFEDKKNGK